MLALSEWVTDRQTQASMDKQTVKLTGRQLRLSVCLFSDVVPEMWSKIYSLYFLLRERLHELIKCPFPSPHLVPYVVNRSVLPLKNKPNSRSCKRSLTSGMGSNNVLAGGSGDLASIQIRKKRSERCRREGKKRKKHSRATTESDSLTFRSVKTMPDSRLDN